MSFWSRWGVRPPEQEKVEKKNPWHDERGRFTFGPDGRSFERPQGAGMTRTLQHAQTIEHALYLRPGADPDSSVYQPVQSAQRIDPDSALSTERMGTAAQRYIDDMPTTAELEKLAAYVKSRRGMR